MWMCWLVYVISLRFLAPIGHYEAPALQREKAEFHALFWWVVENTAEHLHDKMTKWGHLA